MDGSGDCKGSFGAVFVGLGFRCDSVVHNWFTVVFVLIYLFIFFNISALRLILIQVDLTVELLEDLLGIIQVCLRVLCTTYSAIQDLKCHPNFSRLSIVWSFVCKSKPTTYS